MRQIFFLTMAAAFMAFSPAPGKAAVEGVTTAGVNMRQQPVNGSRVITVIPARQRVFIHGCPPVEGWCDVEWRQHRGFVYSRYVAQTGVSSPSTYYDPYDYAPAYVYPPAVIYDYFIPRDRPYYKPSKPRRHYRSDRRKRDFDWGRKDDRRKSGNRNSRRHKGSSRDSDQRGRDWRWGASETETLPHERRRIDRK
jgi:uncharacterized protein YraI